MDVKMTAMHLGTTILKFEMPLEFIDEINKLYDDNVENLKSHNEWLAGKIKEEKRIDNILTYNMKDTFKQLFEQFILYNGGEQLLPHQVADFYRPSSGSMNLKLDGAWINEMRNNEYNPFHHHWCPETEASGLSSVLFLKTPSTYGEEVCNPKIPANGVLQFISGNNEPLTRSNIRVDPRVGDLYIFPFGLYHGVYPFNGTDEVRRTLSYNCGVTGRNI